MKIFISSLLFFCLIFPASVFAETPPPTPAPAPLVIVEPDPISPEAPEINFTPSEEAEASANFAPLVGWGNLFVPGLGATLRGKPGVGLQEAAVEIGLYYGGTFGVKEGNFGIDGTVNVPHTSKLSKPIFGQIMQELGLKYHFYNTFHHYQRAVQLSGTKREIDEVQPIYEGAAHDMLVAPFKWKNVGNAWSLPLIAASSAFLIYSYHSYGVTHFHDLKVSPGDEALFGVSQGIVIPIGGLIGEEPLFRGFIMRESRAYTGSLWASLLLESTAFAAIHPKELRLSAFASGIYFGLMTNHFHGNIEQAMAAHFWVNAVSGVVSYWLMRREQGKNTPFRPPITLQTNLPF
jgi:membrane protease YdiL (CAAX protease family)